MEMITLQSYVGNAVDFLMAEESILNSHMVSFITENVWENRIPQNIAEEINRMTYDDTLRVLFTAGGLKDEVSLMEFTDNPPANCPALIQYLVQCRKFSLDVMSSLDDAKKYFRYEAGWDKSDNHRGNGGKLTLSPQYLTPAKKRHEVSVMSAFIADCFQKYMNERRLMGAIVDIGGGKGYLGSVLALHHGIRVLGVEVASKVSSAAKTRNEKICRKLSEKCSSHQQKTAFVSPRTDLGRLVKELEGEWGRVDCVALVGLHTCGNLGPTSVRLFVSKLSSDVPIRMLCSVGCCYNLLDEKYVRGGSLDGEKPCLPPSLNGKPPEVPLDAEPGFPLSRFLCQRMFSLGRNARNLASQSLERVICEKKISVDALFQRAVLQFVLLDVAENSSEAEKQEVLMKLQKMLIDGKGVGRLAKGNSSLSTYEYVRRAFGKLGLAYTLSEAYVERICHEFADFKLKIKLFYIMRMFLAPVVETVILLDRLLFLLEQGVSEAYLIKLFEPVISPRCYALCGQVD